MTSDEKLDRVDEKLDRVITSLDRISDRIDRLENRIDRLENRFDRLERQLNTYIKSESDIVESDIRQNIQRYFEEKYGINKLRRYDNKLKKISKPYSNDTLAEFDGLFVLEVPGIPGTDVKTDRKFVLIEAKRHVTMTHVKTKLLQYECLKDAIQHANEMPLGLAKKYSTTLKVHKFSAFSGILLYIGGRVWDDDALDALKERLSSSDIGYATVSNATYNIVDGRHLLPSASTIGGAQEKPQGFKRIRKNTLSKSCPFRSPS